MDSFLNTAELSQELGIRTLSRPSSEGQRRRGRRGGKARKRRAGVRRKRSKEERQSLSNLRLMYWNCSSAEQRKVVLERLVCEADVICLQETRLGDEKCVKMAGFEGPVYNRKGHGQLIMVRSTVQFRELDVSKWCSESLHLVAVELLNQPVRNVINVYACNSTMKESDWMVIDDLQRSLPGESVLCGDFNARGALWGNAITNSQGEALEDALDRCDLVCVNDGSMTRMGMRPGDSDSAIDLAITTLRLSTMCEWHTLGPHGNDHFPCTVFVKRVREPRSKRAPKAFHYDAEEVDVIGRLRKQARGTGREKVPILTKPPWWSEELECLWNGKRQALRASQRNKNDQELRDVARQAANTFKQVATEAKGRKYEEFCSEVTADKALHKFWGLYGAMKNRHKAKSIPDFQTDNQVWVKTDAEKGEAMFGRYLAQTNQDNESERREFLNELRTQFGGHNSRLTLYAEDVRRTIIQSADSAPGPDGVKYSHFKSLSDDDIKSLTEVFNESITKGEIPTDWLDSHLAPVPKPEKDPTKIASYRIITMQNTIGKLPEKIVAQMLAAELEKKDLLPPTLGSYRKGKDTWMNAAVLASDVYDGFENGEETVVVALDLEDAYNRVQYDILMRTLVSMGITPELIVWIGEAMLKRTVAMRLGTWASSACTITPGLPQGSALSPVLFNVYTVGITADQMRGPGRTLSFADDGLAYRTGKDRQAIADSVQEELDRIGTWCEDNNGKIHPGKASVLWCSLNNRAVRAEMPEVSINGQPIQREESLRYLGIVFDRTLCGREHITRVITKARRGLNAVKVMARDRMPQRALVLMLDMLVLSQIDYGFGILTLSKTQIKRLEVIQNEGMRAVLGCTRDTSAAAMRHLLGLPNMEERHKLAQVKAFLKVCADPKHPLHGKIGRRVESRLKRGTEWMTQAARTIEECGLSVEAIMRGEAWVAVADKSRASFTKVVATLGRECREWPEGATHSEIQALIEENCREDEMIVYTDGSVQRGTKSGWAFTASRQGVTKQESAGATGLTTSSMCMEVKAITEALKWLSSSKEQSATFLTDSMSTLDKIKRGRMYADWLVSIESSDLSRLQWIFCPGHAGVKGNERADELAGTAVIDGELKLDGPTVLRIVRDHLANRRVEESYTKDRLIENGVKYGEGRKSNVRDPTRRYTNQLMMETISVYTLKWSLQRRAEEVWMNSSQ